MSRRVLLLAPLALFVISVLAGADRAALGPGDDLEAWKLLTLAALVGVGICLLRIVRLQRIVEQRSGQTPDPDRRR